MRPWFVGEIGTLSLHLYSNEEKEFRKSEKFVDSSGSCDLGEKKHEKIFLVQCHSKHFRLSTSFQVGAFIHKWDGTISRTAEGVVMRIYRRRIRALRH